MARTRVVKPEFWDDEKLCTVTRDARLTFIGLWNNSDDYGVVKGNINWLKSRIFPYDDIKNNEFKAWMCSLESLGVIIPFIAHGESYYFIKHFLDHQKVDKPSKTRNPEPSKDILDEHSTNPRRILVDETETETETETMYAHQDALMGRFDLFWKAYPNKKSKQRAIKVWKKIKPNDELLSKILNSIDAAKKNNDWKKENGQYIPYPEKWLNSGGWEDEYSNKQSGYDFGSMNLV